MATIKAVLNRSKRRNGWSSQSINDPNLVLPIYIRLHHKDKRTYRSLGLSVKQKEWDANSGLVRKNNKNYILLNAIIRNAIKKLEGKVVSIASQKDGDIVSSIRKDKREIPLSNFFLIANKYLVEQEEIQNFNAASNTQSIITLIEKFHYNSKRLILEDITVNFLKRFYAFLKIECLFSERKIMNHILTIKLIYKYAIQFGVIDNSQFPFGRGKILIKFPEEQRIGLNENEVKLIELADFSDDKNLDFARDIWLFSFYLAGMRISDVLQIKWTNFIDNRIYYVTRKNNKVVSLKLSDKVKSLLDKYRLVRECPNDYVFGVLSSMDESNAQVILTKMRSANVRINRNLKIIGTRLKINNNISCHIARHSFGHIAGDKISPIKLQRLFRHSYIKTTMGYQANFVMQNEDDSWVNVFNF